MGKVSNGDILLFPANNWVGHIIQWATNSEWSHVAIVASSKLDLVIEAQAGLVRSAKLSKLPCNYAKYRVKKEYHYNVDGVITYLTDALNARYDYLGVLYLGTLKLLDKIGLNTKDMANRFQKDRDYFCSELCYLAFLIGGNIEIVPNMNQKGDIVSPGDIARSPILEKII